MASLNGFNASDVDPAADFEAIPPGQYTAIITESALSFLGVGFPSDFPTWGKLLADAVQRMEEYPERVLLPGIAISLTVLAVNFLGDGLRDALDPRIRGR